MSKNKCKSLKFGRINKEKDRSRMDMEPSNLVNYKCLKEYLIYYNRDYKEAEPWKQCISKWIFYQNDILVGHT